MKKLQEIQIEIKKALEKSKRSGDSVELVIASKYFSIEQIMSFYQEGHRCFGENKVQDALKKMENLPCDISWHFIGHLQKNKVNKIVDKFDLIHSVDSYELAEKISEKSKRVQKILLQVKTSFEESKSGFLPKELLEDLPKIDALKNIKVCGLMTMAPHTDDISKVQESFRTLNEIRKNLGKKEWLLSMGMSQDFHYAIEQGANLVRIGSSLIT